MSDKRLLLALGLGVLLALTGCIAGSFGGSSEQYSVPVAVNNSANETHTFEVYVVELPASMTTHYRDGTVVDYKFGKGLHNYETGPRTVTKIDFPESARFHGKYTLEPGQEKRTTVKNYPHDAVLVVILSQAEQDIFGWASAGCQDDSMFGAPKLIGFKVLSEDDPPVVPGTSAIYECQ